MIIRGVLQKNTSKKITRRLLDLSSYMLSVTFFELFFGSTPLSNYPKHVDVFRFQIYLYFPAALGLVSERRN